VGRPGRLFRRPAGVTLGSVPRFIDISVAVLPGTPEWPGDTPYSCGWSWSISAGSSVNVSRITTSPHVGTHADAPLHVRDGWPGSHELPLDAFIGPAAVLDVSETEGSIDLEGIRDACDEAGVDIERTSRLLLRTGSSIADGGFPEDWPVLTEGTARALLAYGLRLLGVDSPSVDARNSTNLPVHQMLFSGNAFNLENLDLRRVKPGSYELIAPPLRLMALDAAPVRAILVAKD
jgi:arylformamidase